MARDIQDIVSELLMNAVQGSGKSSGNSQSGGSGGGGALSGMKGVAAGAGAAALVPLAVKNLGKVDLGKVTKALGIDDLDGVTKSPGKALGGLTSNLADSLG